MPLFRIQCISQSLSILFFLKDVRVCKSLACSFKYLVIVFESLKYTLVDGIKHKAHFERESSDTLAATRPKTDGRSLVFKKNDIRVNLLLPLIPSELWDGLLLPEDDTVSAASFPRS